MKLRKRASDRLEAVIPKMFDPDEMSMTDVELQLDTGPNLRAHKVILSSSPVLKAALTSLDVRICPIPIICIQGFHRESVQALLQFFYKGVVDMAWGSEIHMDFMALCRTLRVNPPVVKTVHGIAWEYNPPSGNEGDVSDSQDVEVVGEAAPDVEGAEKTVEESSGEVTSNATIDMEVAEDRAIQETRLAELEDALDIDVTDGNAGESDEINENIDVKENISVLSLDNGQGELVEEEGPNSSDQNGQEECIREENNNVTPELANIDELGLDISSDNGTDDKSLNSESVDNEEPDSETVIDNYCSDPVIEDNSCAKLVNGEHDVIIGTKNDSSDERTEELDGAGDKLDEICDNDFLKDDVVGRSLERVTDATTEIVEKIPERYVCDICVEVFSASKDLDEHKQNIHLIDEISDDDTQEETTEAISDFLSKDLGVKSQEGKGKPDTRDNVSETSQDWTAVSKTEMMPNEGLNNIRIESVTSINKKDSFNLVNEIFRSSETSGTVDKGDFAESPLEAEPFEFKMPDSFDLSVDYIKEIVPFNVSNKVEYKGSDDENEDTVGFIGLNKLEFKMPLSDLSSEIKEELDNQPVPDESPSDCVSQTESTSGRQISGATDNVEAITYKKDKSSKSSMRSREKPLQSRRDRKKKDRKLMNSLFGSDDVSEGAANKKERHSSPTKENWSIKKERTSSSNERKSSKSVKKERTDVDSKLLTPSPDGRPSSPMVDATRTPTPTMSISEELKEKRERMMRKMKHDDEEKLDERLESRDYKKEKRKRKKESSPRKRSSIGGTPQKSTHHKGCNSSCRIDHRWSDDESWLVPDDYESSSDYSEDMCDLKVERREEIKSKIKAKIKHVEDIKTEEETEDDDFIDDEDEDDEDEEAKRNRKKRLAERKKKAGGDILFWMNPGHKSKVKVKVQMFAKEDIMDMNYYKMKLLADEGSDTDVEMAKKVSDSDVSSEVSSKRSKSPDYVKRMLDSDTDSSVAKRKKHKKRKKKKRHSSNGTPGSAEKYKRPVSDSSDDEAKSKSKFKKFHRSVSQVSSSGESLKRSNSFTKPLMQRSFSTLESLGISHNYGLSGEAKERSSMPKIPKIAKPTTEMPKIPKIEKSSTDMPKIPKIAKIPKIL